MYNRAILVGRLTSDPELKQTPGGVSVTSFSIAVDRPYTPKGGERQTDFISIVAWRQTADFVARYFSKGKPILIEGSLQSRSYTDKNGQNRHVWEVVADNARFVESKGSTEQHSPPPVDATGNDFTELDEDDGDLPV